MAVEVLMIGAVIDTRDGEPMLRIQRGQTIVGRDQTPEAYTDQGEVMKVTIDQLASAVAEELKLQTDEFVEVGIRKLREAQGFGDHG